MKNTMHNNMNRFANATSRLASTLGLSALVVLVLASGSYAGLNKTRFDVQRRVHNINVLKLAPLIVNPTAGKVNNRPSQDKNQLAANTAPSMVESIAERWADVPPWANTVRQIRCPGAPSQTASTTGGATTSAGDSGRTMAESGSGEPPEYEFLIEGIYSHSGQEHRWIYNPLHTEWPF
jgi:hypothetical protein